MDPWLLPLLLGLGLLLEVARARIGRSHIERWAAERALQIGSCRYRYKRWRKEPEFDVEIIDSSGRVTTGVAKGAGITGRLVWVDFEGSGRGQRPIR